MKNKKIIWTLVIILLLGGYYMWADGRIFDGPMWISYDRQQLKEAGYPPEQSPKINYELAISRSEGEIYFNAHTNYEGVCKAESMQRIKNQIISFGDFTVTCKDNKNAWAMSVVMNNNDSRYWCADSQGNTAAWKEKNSNPMIDTSCVGN